MNWLLPALVVLPLLIGTLLLLGRSLGISGLMGERVGLATSFVLLAISFTLVSRTTPTQQSSTVIAPSLEFAPNVLTLRLPGATSLAANGWQLALGVDGIGVMMVLLTTIVTTAVLIFSHSTIAHRRDEFAAWTLLATSGLLLVFVAMDLLTFYIGFELTLIPLFAMIAIWGDGGASDVAKRFVLYTLAGSIPMVLGLLGIAGYYAQDGVWTISLPELSARAAKAVASPEDQTWIFALLVLGFGIKMALLPLHTWLPKTYGVTHATCGAFLAAVVLKLGLFGFVRITIPLVPQACEMYGPTLMGTLGAAAIVIGALMALAQTELRRLLAYSSLSHVGFITIGLFALNHEGLSGAVLQMFNHGITTAAVFLIVSCIIVRRGTSSLESGSLGIAAKYPKLAAFMVFFLAAGAGLPGLNNFVGELLSLLAMFVRQPLVVAIAALGVVLGAWYAFRLIQVLLFGSERTDRRDKQSAVGLDTSVGENTVFAAFALLCLFIGIYPKATIELYDADTARLSQVFEPATPANADLSEPTALAAGLSFEKQLNPPGVSPYGSQQVP